MQGTTEKSTLFHEARLSLNMLVLTQYNNASYMYYVLKACIKYLMLTRQASIESNVPVDLNFDEYYFYRG